MDNVFAAALLTIFGGSLVALQPAINSTLSGAVGTLPAAAVSFGMGFLALVVLSLVVGGGFGQLGEMRELSWYYVVGGGLIGATYVTVALVSVGSLGAAGVTAATVTGQLTAAVLADRAGILGLTERAVTPARLVGIGLLVIGVFLIVRD